jgi:hypothetical protein
MEVRINRELVLDFRPEARVESRVNPRSNQPEWRVVYNPPPGQRNRRIGWATTETKAWQAACIQLGLRVRKLPE